MIIQKNYLIEMRKKGIIVKGNPFLDDNGNSLYYSKNIKQLIKEGYSKEWKIVED